MKKFLKKVLKLVFYFSTLFLIFISIVLIISQTESFRVLIHDLVESELRKSFGGEIYLGKFYGNIFTGLGIDGFYIKVDGQTFLKTLGAELKYDPIGLIRGRYSFGELVIYKPEIRIIRDKDGKWNFQKVLKPTEKKEKGAKFSVSFDKLLIDDGKFILVDSLHETEIAESLNCINYHNFIVHDINILLSGDYSSDRINLKKLNVSFIVGEGKFNADLKGKFYMDEDELKAEGFEISTGESKLKFNFFASGKNNLFKLDRNTVEEVYMSLYLVADSFSFGELARFIPAVHFLSGSPAVEIEAEGTLKELNVKSIKAKVYDSDIFVTGVLKNITRFPDFLIDAEVRDSKINVSDIERFVTLVKLPELKLKQFNFSGRYRGHPLEFVSGVDLNFGNTVVNLDGALKVKDGLSYDLNFKVAGLNPSDVFYQENLNGSVNFSGNIKGKGVRFETAYVRANVEIESSFLNKIILPKSSFWFELKDGELNGSFVSISEGFRGTVDLNLKRDNAGEFILSLGGSLSGLDVSQIRIDKPKFLKSQISGDINAKFKFGKVSTMEMFVFLNPSYFRNYKINRLRLNAKYTGDESKKNVMVYSNMFDLILDGEFDFADLIKSLSLVAKSLNLKVNEKLNFAEVKGIDFSEVKKPVSLDYNLRFKNLTPISVFSIGQIFQSTGDIKGSFFADSHGFYLYGVSNLKRLVYLNYKSGRIDTVRADNFNGVIEANYSNDELRFGVKCKMGNFFARGFELGQANLDLNFDDAGIYAEISFVGNGWSFGAVLSSEFSREMNRFVLMDFWGDIYGNKLTISNEVEIFQTRSGFVINPSSFVLNGQIIYLSGFFDKQTQQIKLWGENLKVDKFIGVDIFSGDADFSIFIYGTRGKTSSEIEILVKDFKYKGAYLGELKCFGELGDEAIAFNSSLITESGQMRYSSMSVNITIPAWFKPNVRVRYPKPYVIGNVKFLRFPIALFEPLLNGISELRGDISGEVDFRGTFDKPSFKGSVSLQNCTFKFEPNNKYYVVYGRVRADSNVIYVEDLNLWNNPDDYDKGEVQVKGAIYLAGYSITGGELNVNGRLLIVDKEGLSFAGLYGRVIAETGNGGLSLKIDTSGFHLGGEILLSDVDVNYLVKQASGIGIRGGFEYVYVGPADTIGEVETKSEELVYLNVPIEESTGDTVSKVKRGIFSKFDYDLKISTSKTARLNLILNTQTGEEFFAEFTGSLNLRNRSGSMLAYGEVNISDRSYYNFFKRFDASGSLKFMGELQNPELDITANYTGTHTVLIDTLSAGKVETVQITLSISGTLKRPVVKIQMFVNGEDYQKVYPHGDVESDAISFLITGRFKDELTRGEATAFTENLWSSTGASLLSGAVSGVITDVLRDVLGGFITSTEFGYYSGFKGLRITGNIGGAVVQFGGDIFTDISKSVVVVQYPLFRKFFGGNLTVEYQRKPIQFYQEKEIVNKLGLYYRIRL